jgi:hypothetical protein
VVYKEWLVEIGKWKNEVSKCDKVVWINHGGLEDVEAILLETGIHRV